MTSILRWLGQVAGRAHRSRPGRHRRGRRRGFAPCLERLEDRSLLSTFTVTNLDDSGAGSLRQAIQSANANPGADLINFAAAVQGTIALTSGQLVINDDLTIEGPGADALTVSGNHLSRVLVVVGGSSASTAIDVSIAELSVSDGRAPVNAGGIFNGGFSNLTLTRVAVSRNEAIGVAGSFTLGGGIHNNGSGASLTLVDSVVTGNIVHADPGGRLDSFGGGIVNINGARLTVAGSTISGNQVFGARDGSGGGIHANADTSITVLNSIISDNQAAGSLAGIGLGGSGGGINAFRGNLTVINTTIARNRATGGIAVGGGISGESAAVVVSQSIVIGNEALGGEGGIGQAIGGGLANFNITSSAFSSLSITNTMVSDNRAVAGSHGTNLADDISVSTAFGGGIANAFNARLEVANSTLRGNQAMGGNGAVHHAPNIADVGVAHGGGIANFEGGQATVRDSIVEHNQAIGGQDNAGSGSVAFVGTGTGGGIDNSLDDSIFGFIPTRLTLLDSVVRHNEAVGGTSNTASGAIAFVGAGLGGGVANYLGVNADIGNSHFAHNRAIGGDGNTSIGGPMSASLGAGGAIFNALGNFALDTGEVRAPNIVNVVSSKLEHNRAEGGQGAAGTRGGDGWGGAVAAMFDAITNVGGSTLAKNHALGGQGGAGGDGGDGHGGGAYNDRTSSFTLSQSVVTRNHANGGEGGSGGNEGQGLGGGIFNDGLLFVDEASSIRRNKASTGGDDVFGDLAPL